jgi:peptidyl-prolyl cis-trans isomerase C
MFRMLSLRTSLTLIVLALPCLPTPAAAPPTSFPEGVAVLVNGEPILEKVIERALTRAPKNQRAEMRSSLVDHFINNLLIEQHLRASGYKVEKADIDKKVEEIKAECKKADRDYDKMLAGLGVSEAELRVHIMADLRWSKFVDEKATKQALRKLFEDEKESFDGSTVKAQHILLSLRKDETKDAKAVEKRLRAIRAAIEKEVNDGLAKLQANLDPTIAEMERQRLLVESFTKQAKTESDCPSKKQGGAIGAFPKAGVMVAAFSEAAFKLKPYQLSDPVRTPFGYHLILVVERQKGLDVKFEDVDTVVKEVFTERLRERTADELRQKAVILIRPVAK